MDGFKIQAWDLGGQKSIRKYWKAYFDGVDVLVYGQSRAERTPSLSLSLPLSPSL